MDLSWRYVLDFSCDMNVDLVDLVLPSTRLDPPELSLIRSASFLSDPEAVVYCLESTLIQLVVKSHRHHTLVVRIWMQIHTSFTCRAAICYVLTTLIVGSLANLTCRETL